MHGFYVTITAIIIIGSSLPICFLLYLNADPKFDLIIWKAVLCVILFELSFAPFVYAAAVLGWLDIVYVLLLWGLLYTVIVKFSSFGAVFVALLVGVLLSFPLSSLVKISGYSIDITLANWLSLFSSSKDNFDSLKLFYRLFWALAPALSSYVLIKSMKVT
tara:strand:+ start:149 stop:631 length:483 start_codon:yes stop_codon:yes gene_type:complete